MNDYAPLKLLKKSVNPCKEFLSRKAQFINMGCKNLEKMTSSDYIHYFLSEDFYSPWSKHKYKDITLLLMQNQKLLENDLNKSNEYNLITEWKDLYLAPVLIEEWSKFKQVYKPDSDFANALIKTSKLQISESMIEHLPCNYFYIDTSDCENFEHISGIFTFVELNKVLHKLDVILYMLTDNMVYFSYYTGGYFDEKGIINIDFAEIKDHNYEVSLNFIDQDLKKEIIDNKLEFNIDRKTVALLCVQMIAYLSIEKPQITESDLTKGTYVPKLPSAKIKNKWSEVKIEDVGVQYGTSFRKQISEIKKVYLSGAPSTGEKRKSPTPHFRCAHWHKYWVGEGRKQLRLNWIEPVFVGNGDTANVIIHTVDGK